MCRDAHLSLWCWHERARVAVDQLFSPEIAEKRAHGGQLARGGRARLPLLVKIGEKAAERGAIELTGIEVRALQTAPRRRVIEKLSEIALVGADGMCRRVAIKPEKLQKRLEM